jgi:hypothetical protein
MSCVIAANRIRSPDSVISAASGDPALSGTVTINSPDTNILGGITTLPEAFLDAAALMKQHCAAQAAGGRSSLTLRGSRVMAEPDVAYLPASYMDAKNGYASHGLSFSPPTEGPGGLSWGCGGG